MPFQYTKQIRSLKEQKGVFMTNNNNELYALNLQLFAEGGDGGTGAEGSTADTGEFADSTQGVNGGNTNVQTPDAQETDAKPVNRKAEFKKLIKGEYKDEFQAIMNDRLKGTHEQVAKLESLTPLLEMIASKYGVDSQDAAALVKAIEDDNSYYEDEAMERGITVEELKRIRKIERENAAFKKENNEREARERAAQRYQTWFNQAEEAKQIYPGLDLERELENEAFGRLLLAGVDVKSAYQVIHQDEIIPAVMQHTANTVRKKVTDNIAANGRRPSEGGISSQSASVTKTDVSKLSDAGLDDLIRKARNGERIVL